MEIFQMILLLAANGLLICVLVKLSTITKKETIIVAEIDDLKQAVLDETATITDGNATDARLLTDIDQALAKLTTPGINPAEVETAAQAIQASVATMRATNKANADAAAKIEAALNPPPAPAP